MVRKMNKTKFIKELSRRVNLSIDTCSKINHILEENFFISASNKNIIIVSLIDKVGLTKEKAIEVYNEAIIIFNEEIRKK